MADRRRSVVWTASALRALEEVLAYVNEESPSGASRVLTRALNAAESLSTLAERGRVICREPDDKLSYALAMTSGVDVRYYSIAFRLKDVP